MIYKFNDEQYELVKKYVKECCEAEEVVPLIHNDIIYNDTDKTVTVDNTDLVEFMSAADDAIIHFGMVNQDYLTPLGCKLQFLYDEMYYQIKQSKVKFR